MWCAAASPLFGCLLLIARHDVCCFVCMQVVDKVTRGIVAKLIHGPMNHLRQQTEGDATRAAILQVQQAFQLDA
jgi:hypothetical protein